MTDICKPLEHDMTISEMDRNHIEGYCHICDEYLRWDYESYPLNIPQNYNNMDLGWVVNFHFQIPHHLTWHPTDCFGIISQVDRDDQGLTEHGAYILPYRSVTIVVGEGKNQTKHTYPTNYDYNDLKYNVGEYGDSIVDYALRNRVGGWEKVVRNDTELRQFMLGFHDAINKTKI